MAEISVLKSAIEFTRNGVTFFSAIGSIVPGETRLLGSRVGLGFAGRVDRGSWRFHIDNRMRVRPRERPPAAHRERDGDGDRPEDDQGFFHAGSPGPECTRRALSMSAQGDRAAFNTTSLAPARTPVSVAMRFSGSSGA